MQRKQLRLKDFDYSREGSYFVTICVQNGECLFGKVGAGPSAGPSIVNEGRPLGAARTNQVKMVLNEIGIMVKSVWEEMPNFYPGVQIDKFVIMPNHIHGIVNLEPVQGRPWGDAGTIDLRDLMHRFKSLTTARYRHGVSKYNWPRFEKRLWHRSFHDRVIRNKSELFEIRKYIDKNPVNWISNPESHLMEKKLGT